mmetsp:Transcript_1142/g.2366  ORF Transcript_1142/g.2366 Transcript_1142/m.2366 type:complete len:281 (-) Transcript_1142:800-1642(-)
MAILIFLELLVGIIIISLLLLLLCGRGTLRRHRVLVAVRFLSHHQPAPLGGRGCGGRGAIATAPACGLGAALLRGRVVLVGIIVSLLLNHQSSPLLLEVRTLRWGSCHRGCGRGLRQLPPEVHHGLANLLVIWERFLYNLEIVHGVAKAAQGHTRHAPTVVRLHVARLQQNGSGRVRVRLSIVGRLEMRGGPIAKHRRARRVQAQAARVRRDGAAHVPLLEQLVAHVLLLGGRLGILRLFLCNVLLLLLDGVNGGRLDAIVRSVVRNVQAAARALGAGRQ